MKLLQIIPSYWPAQIFGGTIFSSYNLNTALVKRGLDLSVFTTNSGINKEKQVLGEVSINGAKVTYFGYNRILDFFGPTGWQFSLPMKNALRERIKEFDLVYIIGIWNYPNIMASHFCLKYHIPYIVSPRGMLYPYSINKKGWKKWFLYQAMVRNSLSQADLIHYTSEDEAEKCHDYLRLKNKKAVIPNGINLSEFENLPSKDKLKKTFPNLTGKRVILYLGRLNWKKGLDILIEAFSKLVEKDRNICLLISGGDESGYKNKLVNLARKLKIEEFIIFTGFVSGERKLEMLSGSDIFILPSYSENFGMSTVEAMAAGIPVVVSNQVGISNEIERNNSGLIIETSVKSIREGLSKLLYDDKLKNSFSTNGINLVKSAFDVNIVADKMMSLFENTYKDRK